MTSATFKREKQHVSFSKLLRKKYSSIKAVLDIPDLLGHQRRSYDQFLQMDIPPEKRVDVGMQAGFKAIFPQEDLNGVASLEFCKYELFPLKHDEDECRERGLTYAMSMKATFQLVLFDVDPETSQKSIRDVKEQDIYFGDIPAMTDKGTFIIEGIERVVVSQLHRSPGVFFEVEKQSSLVSSKPVFAARIIPYRGSWLDFEFDFKENLYLKVDKRKKIPVGTFLKALGHSEEELLSFFYEDKKESVRIRDGRYLVLFNEGVHVGIRAYTDFIDPSDGSILVKRGQKITKTLLSRLKDANIEMFMLDKADLVNRINAQSIVNPKNDEVIIKYNEELTLAKLDLLLENDIKNFDILYIDEIKSDSVIRRSLLQDKSRNRFEALREIIKRLRPGISINEEIASQFLYDLLFNPDRYDLTRVGRHKLNLKLREKFKSKGLEPGHIDDRVLRKEDIICVIDYLLDLKNGISGASPDDIDHLGNRRVRTVGELVDNYFRLGLLRMSRVVKERFASAQTVETLMPHDLVNPKPISAVLKEFYGSSQLSQFMDQTNPLAEITHKRRLSALGPGGLTRERAGFEVRDVHTSHYGRICPIETPEGPNIGLIASLTTYARINEFGFIETPYKRVMDGKVVGEIVYLAAYEEEGYTIAQANAKVGEEGGFISDFLLCRRNGEFIMVNPKEVDFMDVSPVQLVSIASSLIPFLEHDDANRALMGSNMQRQGVPLVVSEPPLVGTGMEAVVAKDSRAGIQSLCDGVVESVDANKIVVRPFYKDRTLAPVVNIHRLAKYQKTNQNTFINHRPIVKVGKAVQKGEIIADGQSTDRGELALGRNILVAFMSWGGYNFEDSIIVSERLVKDDVFTSVHIEDFECVARETKLGKEEITGDIPNVGEQALKDLDETGVVRIGAYVRPGNILVGKVTPKGETQLTPEEKLLRAIFGDKASDVKDSSLRVSSGVEGTVIRARIFTKKGAEKDEFGLLAEREELQHLRMVMQEEVKLLERNFLNYMRDLFVGQKVVSTIELKHKNLNAGEVLTKEILELLSKDELKKIVLQDERKVREIADCWKSFANQTSDLTDFYNQKIQKLKKGEELPSGVLRKVRVSVAVKRRLHIGDKMAGRHGNKGVVSVVLPIENMPYIEDGTPVDMILNPLGVPSRMNVGQIMETHLGWACFELGKELDKLLRSQRDDIRGQIEAKLCNFYESDETREFLKPLTDEEFFEYVGFLSKHGLHVATNVFDGAKEGDIKELLDKAGLPRSGQTILYDGKTGDPFMNEITIGYMYMLKLNHLAADKIHARSIGPYSLVTQQPLGGKAQFGGQRLGEMEVWALEAYGASYALQEFLTVKSDDVIGRTTMYESIVKGRFELTPGLPESFNVLIRELRSLALDVELIEHNRQNGNGPGGGKNIKN